MCRMGQTQFDSLYLKAICSYGALLPGPGNSPRRLSTRERREPGTSEGGAQGSGRPGRAEESKAFFFFKSENTLTALRTKFGALLVRIIKWRSVQECGLLAPHSCRRLWEERLLTSCDWGLSPWDFLSWAVLRAPAIPQPLALPPTGFHHL